MSNLIIPLNKSEISLIKLLLLNEEKTSGDSHQHVVTETCRELLDKLNAHTDSSFYRYPAKETMVLLTVSDELFIRVLLMKAEAGREAFHQDEQLLMSGISEKLTVALLSTSLRSRVLTEGS